jgi:hypothetical protein
MGRGCKFTHLKKCKPWERLGSLGCKLGKNCSKVHTKLCNTSVKDKICFLAGCRKTHLQGTNFTPPKEKESSPPSHKSSVLLPAGRTGPQSIVDAPAQIALPSFITNCPPPSNTHPPIPGAPLDFHWGPVPLPPPQSIPHPPVPPLQEEVHSKLDALILSNKALADSLTGLLIFMTSQQQKNLPQS